jgi:hypothetical protein
MLLNTDDNTSACDQPEFSFELIVKDWQEFFISKIEDLAKDPPKA